MLMSVFGNSIISILSRSARKYEHIINPKTKLLMNKIETLNRNVEILSFVIGIIDYSVYDEKDAKAIRETLESAKDLSETYLGFENGSIRTEA